MVRWAGGRRADSSPCSQSLTQVHLSKTIKMCCTIHRGIGEEATTLLSNEVLVMELNVLSQPSTTMQMVRVGAVCEVKPDSHTRLCLKFSLIRPREPVKGPLIEVGGRLRRDVVRETTPRLTLTVL